MSARLAPWDRRADESAPAFEAFAAYRDMGPGRTQEAVGAALAKSRQLLSRWAVKYAWAERVAAFDTEAARIAGKASLQGHAAVRARQAQLGRLMQQRSAQKFALMAPEDMTPGEAINAGRTGAAIENAAEGIGIRVEHTGADGGPIETVALTPEEAIAIARRRREAAERKGKA